MKQGLTGEGPRKTAGFLEGRLELRAEKEGRLEGILQPGLEGREQRSGDRRREALRVRDRPSV